MGVLAVQVVLTRFPVAVLTDGRAFLRHVEENVRGSSEILLAMGVIAFTPFVLLIN